MTRETKIGLLVGLAFIIVIGILLSDHLTSSTDPPPAALAPTGRNVLASVTTPGGTQPPITPVVTPPEIQPQSPVMTNRDLEPPTPGREVVHVSGPSAQQPVQPIQDSGPAITAVREEPQPGTIAPTGPSQQPTQSDQQHMEVAGADSPRPVFADHPIARIAQQQNEAVVAVNQTGSQAQARRQSPTQSATGMREYVAQPGDNLSRMANKLLGGNTKANRDAIARANPVLQQDPNKVIVGKTYLIPPSADAVAASTTIRTVGPTGVTPAPAPRQTAPSPTEYWYTVKEGDSLWKIAEEQLGNGGAWASIKELNKDVLGDNDTVVTNMRLRLPSRPLARAN